MIASTGASNGLKNLPTLLRVEEQARGAVEPPHKKRRFSQDAINDLLFWGCHLVVVGIALAVVWTRIDSLTKAMRNLIALQNKEVELVQRQAQIAEVAAVNARAAEHTRALQVTASIAVLDRIVGNVNAAQADIQKTLDTTSRTNELLVAQIQATKEAALGSQMAATQAAGAARNAAGAAGGAANAASRAAAASSRTGTVVAAKVATTSDKRQLVAEQRALAAKRQQLSKTIRQVKKNGPTLLQKIFQ